MHTYTMGSCVYYAWLLIALLETHFVVAILDNVQIGSL